MIVFTLERNNQDRFTLERNNHDRISLERNNHDRFSLVRDNNDRFIHRKLKAVRQQWYENIFSCFENVSK